MNLTNPEARRALRSVIIAIVQLGFLALVWRLAEAKDTHWLIAVIAIAVVGYQIENGVRSFKIGKDGIEAQGGEGK
jgi:hypothetical protein